MENYLESNQNINIGRNILLLIIILIVSYFLYDFLNKKERFNNNQLSIDTINSLFNQLKIENNLLEKRLNLNSSKIHIMNLLNYLERKLNLTNVSLLLDNNNNEEKLKNIRKEIKNINLARNYLSKIVSKNKW